jgi:putative ABC transport system permease protein
MTGPPRLAESLLRHTLPRGEAGETIRGDLIEEWRHRGASSRATLWYWRHALSLSARYAWRRRRNEPSSQCGQDRRHNMFLDNLMQDVRYAVRSYVKAPSFAVAILATLALGIGASTAIFSMVNGILLRPLPLPDPDRLVFATEVNGKNVTISTSVPNYFDWRARAHSFETLALSSDSPQTLTGLDQARRIRARRVTGNFFRAIGIAPALGHDFTDDDDRPNATPAVIVTDGFWKTALGGDPAIIGGVLTLNQISYTVVGVMPSGFEYLRPYDAFVSFAPIVGSRNIQSRGNHNGFAAVGRLKPGVTVESARAELTAVAAQLEREYPETNTGVGVLATRLADRLVTTVRTTLLALFGAVGCLLLIACTNVASLLVARGAARQHELAVRAALGGGRLRLMGQLLVDSTIISAAGGALGVLCAIWLLRLLVAAAPDGTPRITNVQIDAAAVLFAAGAAALCGLVFGAFPAFQAAGTHGQQALVRGRTTGFAARSHHVRRALIVVETALAIVLLVGAGLMVRTVQQLISVDAGFRPDHVLTTRFTLSGPTWTEERRQAFYPTFIERIRAIPGVSSAALTIALPIDGSQWNSIFIVADKPVPQRSQLPSAAFTPVSLGFFETMGVRLVGGRVFGPSDTPTSSPTIVVNETLAKTLWPGEDAVGKRLKQGWPEDKNPWREVVGVVADVKFNGLASDTPLQVYLPLTQESQTSLIIAARTAVEPMSIVPTLEAVAREVNRDMPLFQTATMDQVLETSIAQQRLSLIVMVTFAIVALTLASVGLYGVIAHAVTERTHEIGVRLALGAEAHHVLGLIVRQGVTTTIVGVAIGVVGAIALSRFIQDLLFGVTPTDPLTFAAVIIMLIAVSLAACYIPAWRATRLDPTMALRSE